MTAKCALLWNTHVWCRELEQEFEKILSLDSPGSLDIWLVLDAKIPGAGEIAKKYKRCQVIDPDDLFGRLPYPPIEGFGILHHSHFPVLDFFLTHSDYDYYWFIEFDVRYSGDWRSFFTFFEPYTHDFIASHIRSYDEEPLWHWWDTLRHPVKTILRDRDGWQGFNEVSLPTLLHKGGYRIMDFGGDGRFTPPELKNRSYTSHGLKDGLLSPFERQTLPFSEAPADGRAGHTENEIRVHLADEFCPFQSVKADRLNGHSFFRTRHNAWGGSVFTGLENRYLFVFFTVTDIWGCHTGIV